MLSRMADNLYWFGRYLRRAENTARLINVNANLVLDLPREQPLGWRPLVEMLGAGAAFAEIHPQGDVDAEADVVRFLTVEIGSPASISFCIERAREILRVSREVMPRATWEELGQIYFFVCEHAETPMRRTFLPAFLTRVVDGILLLYGMLQANMSRDVSFHFLRLGMAIEQADMTSRILEARVTQTVGDWASARALAKVQWISVLRSLSAYQMYRWHRRGRINAPGVLAFLLQDPQCPRSVAYSLASVNRTLSNLPQSGRLGRELDRARALVRDADVAALFGRGQAGMLLDEIQIALGRAHQALVERYFNPV